MPTIGSRSSRSRSFLLALAAAAAVLGATIPAAAQSGTIIKPKKLHTTVYPAMYATSGSGTHADPYVTSGSNPVAAALAACPAAGCTIDLQDYEYTLGSADPAVTITKTSTGTDTRFYRVVGHGAILNYSGSGTAIRVWQDNTGTPGASIQGNFGNEMSGFSLRQTGTGRTGIGIWFNYATLWSIHDIEIGTRKADRTAGDNGFLYGIKFAEKSGGYQTVDDFTTIDHCRFSGNTHAIYAGQQADNLRVRNCYFEANPNISAAQDGFEIANSNGVSFVGNAFNFFNFSGTMFGIKISTDMSGVTISGNYFEGNRNGVYLYNDLDQDGIVISGNVFSLNSVTGTSGQEAYGIRAGIDGATYKIRGLVIQGNEFTSIGDNEAGFRIGSDVPMATITGNYYTRSGTTNDFNNVLQNGSQVAIVGEAAPGATTATDVPEVRIIHGAPDFPGVRIENATYNGGCTANLVPWSCCTGSGAGTCIGNSPWFQWVSGGTSHLAMSSYVDSSGNWYLYNGSARLTVGVAGVITAGGSFSGALTGNVTGDVTGGVTAGSGKTITAASGTMIPRHGNGVPGSCTADEIYLCDDCTSGQRQYGCESGTFKLQGDGGGSVAFSALSGGTNTTAGSMIAGNGVTLNYSGSGDIHAKEADAVTQNITFNAANVTGTVAADHGGTGRTFYAQGDITYAAAANPSVLTALGKDTNPNRYLANTGTTNNPKWDQIDLGVAGSFANSLGVTKGGTGLTAGTSGGVPYFNSSTGMASSAALASTGIVIGGGAGAAPLTSAATASAGGSIALPTAQTIDIAAHATDGGSLVLKEGADDGTNIFTLKVPNSGLSADKTITLQGDGAVPASGIEGTGTASRCARFDASHVLVEASGDCSAGGGGSGTVTGVGPGCTTGTCFTNGTASSGTVMFDWEGTTVDANDISVEGPADPTHLYHLIFPDATASITLPGGTDTLAGKATTDTFTNKTLDVEGTGNAITTVEKIWLPAAGCNNATAATFWDLPTSNAPTPTCVTGSNTQKAYLDFPDLDGLYSAQTTLVLPSDWTGAIDAKIKWLSAITTGDVFWQVSTICVADGVTDDPAFNTASTVADTAKGTTLQTNDASITGVTATGCVAGSLLHLKIARDRTNGSDTLGAAAARLIGVEITLRRTQ